MKSVRRSIWYFVALFTDIFVKSRQVCRYGEKYVWWMPIWYLNWFLTNLTIYHSETYVNILLHEQLLIERLACYPKKTIWAILMGFKDETAFWLRTTKNLYGQPELGTRLSGGQPIVFPNVTPWLLRMFVKLDALKFFFWMCLQLLEWMTIHLIVRSIQN